DLPPAFGLATTVSRLSGQAVESGGWLWFAVRMPICTLPTFTVRRARRNPLSETQRRQAIATVLSQILEPGAKLVRQLTRGGNDLASQLTAPAARLASQLGQLSGL